MPADQPRPCETPPPFTEKNFYLEEFHGKTVAIAGAAAELCDPAELSRVVDELVANGTWVLLLSTDRGALEPLVGERILRMDTPQLEGRVWRELQGSFRLGLVLDDAGAFAPTCREVAVRLGLFKLVWLDRDGGIVQPGGQRASFIDQIELRKLLATDPASDARRAHLLREVAAMLEGGVSAVNVCTLHGLHDELFTYNGSGTLFTPERYVIVRRLGIDDFDAASDLIARGTQEGYLAVRDAAQLDEVLASGFGAFIEGRHLAGLGALLVDTAERSGEVASLYTLTRFLGEGVGAHLLAHAIARAQALDLACVYACTTSERVAAFFERNGFERVTADRLPDSKWRGYDPERRARVLCLRRELAPHAPAAGERRTR